MNYDETDVADRYHEARGLSCAKLDIWLDAIARSLADGERLATIVDLGCGTGRFSGALANRFETTVIGVDPSRSMLAQAISNVPQENVTFRSGDAQNIPVEDESVSLILLSMVYHHIDSMEEAAGREHGPVLIPIDLFAFRKKSESSPRS